MPPELPSWSVRPPLLRVASFYAALPSTTAVATAITATAVVITTAPKAEVIAADPPAEVGARSAVLSRPAAPRVGSASSALIFLPVSASLLITLFASWWHAIPYYVGNPTNIHHDSHHTTGCVRKGYCWFIRLACRKGPKRYPSELENWFQDTFRGSFIE
jgi:hypothetical protein